MRIILAAAALSAASPAAASTLVLYDVDASYGDRLALTPLLEQQFARNTYTGVSTPVVVPVNDDGSPRTVEVQYAGPVPVYPLAPGTRVQRGQITWRITTTLTNGTLSYEAVIVRRSVFTDGVTVTAPSTDQTAIVGTGSASRPGPIIARRYVVPGGARMLIGFLKP